MVFLTHTCFINKEDSYVKIVIRFFNEQCSFVNKIAKFTPHSEAEQEILNWCDKVSKIGTDISEFKTVILTYKSWIKEIVNSFIFDPITKSRITNGFIEGKNNLCKVIKRVGFGYKNFLFRAKVIYK